MNAIERELSPEEVDAFCARLRKTKGGFRLQVIQRLALEEGIKISHQAANNFRRKTFERYCDRMRRTAEVAEKLKEYDSDADSRNLGDASASLIAEILFDKLIQSDKDVELDDLKPVVDMLAKIRAGDAKTRELKVKCEQHEEAMAMAKKKLEESRKQGGITEETLNEIEAMLGISL